MGFDPLFGTTGMREAILGKPDHFIPTLNPEQQQVSKSLGSVLDQRISEGPQQFQGQLKEPLGTQEAATLSRLRQLESGAGNTLESLQQFDEPTFRRQFDEEVANPTLQFTQREILPSGS